MQRMSSRCMAALLAQRLIVMPRSIAEGRHDSRQIVSVLPADMFVDERQLGAGAVTEDGRHVEIG